MLLSNTAPVALTYFLYASNVYETVHISLIGVKSREATCLWRGRLGLLRY